MSRQATSSAVVLTAVMIIFVLGWLPPVAAQQNEAPPDVGVEESGEDPLDQVDELIAEGSYAEAENLTREILIRYETTYGEDSIEVAWALDLLVQSMWRGGKVNDPEVLELAERALEIKESVRGPADKQVAVSLMELSNVFQGRQEYEKADDALLRSQKIYEDILGPDDPDVAGVLHNRVNILVRFGDFAQAKELSERELDIYEAAFGPDSPQSADALSVRAEILIQMGEGGYLPLLERSLAINERALGPEHPWVANSMNSLGLTLLDNGEYLRAKELLEQSLAIYENRLGSDHISNGGPHINLGILYSIIADPSRAVPHYKMAVEIASANSYGALEAVALANLGIMNLDGDYVGSIRHFERALALLENDLGPEHARVAWVLHLLGGAKMSIGDLEEARILLEKALEMISDPDHGGQDLLSAIQSSLGKLEEKTGNNDSARFRFEQAVETAERLNSPDHPEVANQLIEVAGFYLAAGDSRAARQRFERALSILQGLPSAGNGSTTSALVGLARVAQTEGDSERAIELYRQVLDIQERTWGPDYPGIAATLSGFAEALVATGNSSEAFNVVLRAEDLSREYLRVTTRGLAEREALSYASVRDSGLDMVLSLAADHPAPARTGAALDSLIRSRAVILDEMARRHRLAMITDDPEVAALAAELAAARSWLAHLTVQGAGDLEPEQYREILTAAQKEKELAERKLAAMGMSEEAITASERAGLEEVSASILAVEALVAFARYERHPSEPGGDAQQESPDPVPSYVAFVLRGGQSTPILVDLGDAEVIDRLVLVLQRQMARVSKAPEMVGKREEIAYRRVAGALRNKVWDPVAPDLKGMTKVLIVPDGGLNLVSLAALPVGESEYLIEGGMEILYLSAERDLALASASPIGVGMVALGNPAFDRAELVADLAPQGEETPAGTMPHPEAWTYRGPRSSCGDFRTMRFKPLPASAGELDEVVALWNAGDGGSVRASRLRGASAPRNDVVRLEGAAAGEAAFKAAAPGRRGLHLATHGFFLGGSCASALDPGVAEAVVYEDRNLAENPLLLSGFALAGANLREEAGEGEEDGILTAEEIASIDLSGVEWAVLSACNTGVGEIRAGEGVFGLRRAFRVAGVETLIMSLWPVEDEASRDWMTTFYGLRFEKGLGIAGAVHTASFETLNARRAEGQSTHPFFWAAFVAAGR